MKKWGVNGWLALAAAALLLHAGSAVDNAFAIPAATGGGFEGGPPAGYSYTGPALVGTLSIQYDSQSPSGQSWFFEGSCGGQRIRTYKYPTGGFFDFATITNPQDLLFEVGPEAWFNVYDQSTNQLVSGLCWPKYAGTAGLLIPMATGNLLSTANGIVAQTVFMPAVP